VHHRERALAAGGASVRAQGHAVEWLRGVALRAPAYIRGGRIVGARSSRARAGRGVTLLCEDAPDGIVPGAPASFVVERVRDLVAHRVFDLGRPPAPCVQVRERKTPNGRAPFPEHALSKPHARPVEAERPPERLQGTSEAGYAERRHQRLGTCLDLM